MGVDKDPGKGGTPRLFEASPGTPLADQFITQAVTTTTNLPKPLIMAQFVFGPLARFLYIRGAAFLRLVKLES